MAKIAAIVAIGAISLAILIMVGALFLHDGLNDNTKVVQVPGPTVTTTKVKKVPGPTKTVTVNRYPECPPGMLNGTDYETSKRLEEAGGCIWHP